MTIQKIVNALIKLGLTTYDIAEALDLDQGTVSRYSTGDIKRCMSDVHERAKNLLQRKRTKAAAEKRAKARAAQEQPSA